MNENEFIENAIDQILEKFNNIIIAYFKNEKAKTNFISILPKEIFLNDNFIELIADITNDYYSLDYEDTICFISDDSFIKPNCPIKYYYGIDADSGYYHKSAESVEEFFEYDKYKYINFGVRGSKTLNLAA